MGSIKVDNKDISYGGFIFVEKLTQEIIDKQQNKVIKVQKINEKKEETTISSINKTERKNKKQDKNINGGN
jgi:hypothetical protein